MENLEKLFGTVIESEDLTKEFLKQETMDEMYEFFLKMDSTVSKEDFDEFVASMLESYSSMSQSDVGGDFNTVAGGKGTFGAKLSAAALSALTLLSGAGPGAHAAGPGGSTSIGEISAGVAGKIKKAGLSTADFVKGGWNKTKEWVKKHPKTTVAIALALITAAAVGTKYYKNKKSPKVDDTKKKTEKERLEKEQTEKKQREKVETKESKSESEEDLDEQYVDATDVESESEKSESKVEEIVSSSSHSSSSPPPSPQIVPQTGGGVNIFESSSQNTSGTESAPAKSGENPAQSFSQDVAPSANEMDFQQIEAGKGPLSTEKSTTQSQILSNEELINFFKSKEEIKKKQEAASSPSTKDYKAGQSGYTVEKHTLGTHEDVELPSVASSQISKNP